MTKRRDGEGVLQAQLIIHPAKNSKAQAFCVQVIRQEVGMLEIHPSGS